MNKSLKEAKEFVVFQIIKKLENTYKDYIQNVEGFDKIPDFFKNYLYAPSNKEERDMVLENLYNKLLNLVGKDMVENIYKLIQLIKISDELDLEIAEELLKQNLISDNHFDFENIEKIIHKKNQYEKRKQQIELICETLSFFFALAKLPVIKLVMAPIKVAANLVGAEVLVETMEEGYKISKNIKDMKPFIQDFRKRELEFLDKIKSKYSYS
ncbi:MAG: FFLEELY motif protein [Leptonema sp. (in: bacteria)]